MGAFAFIAEFAICQVHDQNLNSRNDVKFILPLGRMNLILKNDGFSYDTYKINAVDQSHNWEDLFTRRTPEKQSNTRSYHRVDIEFAGANINPQIIAEGKSKDYLNFYGSGLGENGVTDVRIYQKVTYKNIYPNIDVEFVNENNNAKPAEFNFVLRPGANISDIRLKYKGASSTELVKGELKLNLQHGTLTETIPLSYWQRSHKKEKISYVLIKQPNGEVMITYSGLNKPITETLVVDPTPNLDWGTYYGIGMEDRGEDICHDNLGNIYTIGWTSSTSNIATAGAFESTLTGVWGGFLVKFDSNGNRQWGTYCGNASQTLSYGVATDKNNNIYIAGSTQATSGIATIGAHQSALAGYTDAFLAKFNPSGGRIWSTYYGGVEDALEDGFDVCTDTLDNVYLCGATTSSTGIATSGVTQTAHAGPSNYNDAFLVKFNSNGVRQWGTYCGGTNFDYAYSLCHDIEQNIYIGGLTKSIDTIPTLGCHQYTIGSGTGNGFVAKYNSITGRKVWGTYYGGQIHDQVNSLTADLYGNIFCVGQTQSGDNIASSNGFDTTIGAPGSDGFIAKFNKNGQRTWGTYYGAQYNDIIYGAATDSTGSVYVAGLAQGPGGLATPGSYQSSPAGGNEAFIVKFDSTGSRIFCTYYGGSYGDAGTAISVFKQNEICITGSTTSPDGIATPGALYTSNFGTATSIAFITKFSNTGSIGINELNKEGSENDILIYPNPNNGEFIIKVKEETELTIYNELGQLVRILKIDNKERVNFNCKNGIYFINGLNKSGKRISKKIVVLN